MNITVQKLSEHFHFEAENETGGKVRLDGDAAIGGLEGGLSPMELLLAGAGGCSAIDVVNILEKQQQPLDDLNVEVEGNREDVGSHSEFKSINLHFTLSGDLDEKKAKRAIELSMEKYCSVSKTLEKGADISYSYEIE